MLCFRDLETESESSIFSPQTRCLGGTLGRWETEEGGGMEVGTGWVGSVEGRCVDPPVGGRQS